MKHYTPCPTLPSLSHQIFGGSNLYFDASFKRIREAPHNIRNILHIRYPGVSIGRLILISPPIGITLYIQHIIHIWRW